MKNSTIPPPTHPPMSLSPPLTMPPQAPLGDVHLEPVQAWLTALIRASHELLETYVIGRPAPRDEPAPAPVLNLLVTSTLSGSTHGELRCRLDPGLSIAVAEGMWGQPAAALSEAQVRDAVSELCGQIIGYAAGEVSAGFPGVIFQPPRVIPLSPGQTAGDAGLPALAGGDRALVPTRLGGLHWEISDVTAPGQKKRRPSQQALTVRDRIRGLRETDLQLLQAVRVLGVDDQADDAFEQLLKSVGSDPALTARILRRVNSALARPRGSRIQSLPQALIFLGTRAAKNIVISALLSQSVGAPHAARRGAAVHSVHVAVMARHLGLLLGLDGDECYLLGLLHDLGRLILDRLYPDDSAELAGLPEEELLQHELRHFGITHPEAGAIAAMAWHFPDGVRLAMTAHHDRGVVPYLGLQPHEAQQILVVAQADRLAECIERTGPGTAGPIIEETAQMLRRSPALVRECLERAMEQFAEEDGLGEAV